MAKELKDSGIVTALSVVGFVFGLIGMLCSFIPLLGSLAFFIGIPAGVISGIALAIAYSQNAKRTFSIVALTISLIGVAVSGFQYFTIISAGEKAKQALERINRPPVKSVPGKNQQLEQPVPSQFYEKADWKQVQLAFELASKAKGIYPSRPYECVLAVGGEANFDTGYDTKIRVLVNGALTNKNDPDNNAIAITIYRVNSVGNSEVAFDGMLYQADPLIVKSIFEDTIRLTFQTQYPAAWIPPTVNNFIHEASGKLNLQYKDHLYMQSSKNGDVWSKRCVNTKAFVIDPNNKNIVYVITAKGTSDIIEKSMQGGTNWLTITSGLPETRMNNIVINPHNSQELFLLTGVGLFRTVDAGFVWEPMSLRESVLQLIVDPELKSKMYSRTYNGLFISNDSGSTWRRIDGALPTVSIKGKDNTVQTRAIKVTNVTYVNSERPYILAVTVGKGIFKSENDGTSWSALNDGYNINDGAYSLFASNEALYMGSYGCIYYLPSGEHAWKKIDLQKAEAEPITAITGIFPLHANDCFMVADVNGRLIYVDINRNHIGLNYGVMPHSKVLSFKASVVDGQTRLYAHVYNGHYCDKDNYGMFVSTDNGITWRKMLIYTRPYGGGSPSVYISPLDGKEMWMFDDGSNSSTDSWVTYDCGATWKNNAVWPFNELRYLYFDPQEKNTKYACLGSLFINKNQSQQWTDLKMDTKRLLITVDTNNTKYILTDNLNLSSDNGWTWHSIKPDVKGVSGDRYRLIYFTPDDILVMLSSYYSAHGRHTSYLLSSSDIGKAWKLLSTIDYEEVYFHYVNPLNINNVFMVKDTRLGPTMGDKLDRISVMESFDRGRTWKQIYATKYSAMNIALDEEEMVTAIATANERGTSVIYLGTSRGVKKTCDDGATWTVLGGIAMPSTN